MEKGQFNKWFKWLIAFAVLLVIAVPGAWFTQVQAQSQPTSGKTQLLWYGQSAFKITTPSGHVLLLDPFIANPANKNAAADLANLNKVDYILITHGHGDHVGNAVEIAKKTQAKLISTFDLGNALAAFGGYPKELVPFETQGNFGGELTLFNGEVKVAFIPAVHSSTVSTDGTPQLYYAGNPGGFLVSVRNGPAIYHTGDTDLFNDMTLIPQFRRVTVMLACIGGKFTMGPERAAIATQIIDPQVVIPMHYGTYNLPGTPEQFTQALKQQRVRSRMQVMKVGETLAF